MSRSPENIEQIQASSSLNREEEIAADICFVRRILLGLLVLSVAAAAWFLSDVLLLLFGSILLAILFRAAGDALRRIIPVTEELALLLASVILLATIALTAWLFGAEITAQVGDLARRLPRALQQLNENARLGPWAELLKSSGTASNIGNILSKVLSWSTMLIGTVISLVIVVFGAIFLAAEPDTYRNGFLTLLPSTVQPHVRSTLTDCANALRRWLAAQLIAMVAVGLMVATGLLVIGLQSALALGLIAALAEFIPYVGPIAAAIPALIIAASKDWQTAGWTLLLYITVQTIESNLLMPLLASRAVAIRPALAMFGIVATGLLFGPLGLMLGFPLLVVIDTAVRRLYISNTLQEPVEILGEPIDPHDQPSIRSK